MGRYLASCNNDTKKAMTLYRKNLHLSAYARQHYGLIMQLFQWMSIDESALLYGLDHINEVCNDIDKL